MAESTPASAPRTPRPRLTDRAMQSSPTGHDEWFPDGGARSGHGKLYGRITKAGERVFVLRYRNTAGRLVNWSIGRYESKATNPEGADSAWVLSQSTLSVGLARRKAALLTSLHAGGVRDLREHFDRERRIADATQAAELARIEAQAEADRVAAQAERDRSVAAEAARRDAESYNLRALLDAYVRHLERLKKSSVSDARTLFKNHVYGVPDGPAERPAREIETKEITALLRRLVEAGKGRTAGKLRSFMRAAYALAFQAEYNPEAPADLIPFRIQNNPVAPTASLSQHIRARDRVLSPAELRCCLGRIRKLSVAQADALQLALLLGGQRPTQLLRATLADVDPDGRTLTLRDGKGRRKQPRVHILPLQGEAWRIVERLSTKAEMLGTPWLFTSTDVGPRCVPSIGVPVLVADVESRSIVPLRIETISEAISGISADMLEAKESREPFKLGDLRRTCETMLAALGHNSDTRAQLQSHGLGGVQARHYDRHDYMHEKRRALSSWERRVREIERDDSKVKDFPVKRLRRRSTP